MVSFVACREELLHRFDMKMLRRFCVVAIKSPMQMDGKDVVDDGVKFGYVEMFAYFKFQEDCFVLVNCRLCFIHFFQRSFCVNLKMSI